MAELPASIGFKSMQIESYWPYIISTSLSGKRQTRRIGGHVWKLSIKYPTLSQSQFALIDNVILDIKNHLDVLVTYPINNQGTWRNDSPTVATNYNFGSLIDITNLTVGATITHGDFIQFANSVKVYKIIGDFIADSNGSATVKISPYLYNGLSVGVVVISNNVKFNVGIDSSHKYQVAAPNLYGYSLKCTESLL